MHIHAGSRAIRELHHVQNKYTSDSLEINFIDLADIKNGSSGN